MFRKIEKNQHPKNSAASKATASINTEQSLESLVEQIVLETRDDKKWEIMHYSLDIGYILGFHFYHGSRGWNFEEAIEGLAHLYSAAVGIPPAV